MSQPLTSDQLIESEAWLKIAQIFEDVANFEIDETNGHFGVFIKNDRCHRYGNIIYGICQAILYLDADDIPEAVYLKMQRSLRYKRQQMGKPFGYIFDLTEEGHAQRAQLCRELAQECLEGL